MCFASHHVTQTQSSQTPHPPGITNKNTNDKQPCYPPSGCPIPVPASVFYPDIYLFCFFFFFFYFFSFFVLCFVGSVRVRVPRLKRDAAQARASAVSGRKQPHVTGNFRTHSAFGRLHRTRRAQNKPKRQPLAVPVPRIRILSETPKPPQTSPPMPSRPRPIQRQSTAQHSKAKYTVLTHGLSIGKAHGP